MNFVTITDLAHHPTEAVLGFERHAFGVAVLRIRCKPALDEPTYFPPCTADPDLALVLLSDGWLTHGALVEAARVYMRCSGEWGPVRGRGEEVIVRYWVPRASWQSGDGLPVFLHPDGEIACQIPVLACVFEAITFRAQYVHRSNLYCIKALWAGFENPQGIRSGVKDAILYN